MTIDDFIGALGTDSLQSRYFQILSDQHPHCRKCAQQQIGSGAVSRRWRCAGSSAWKQVQTRHCYRKRIQILSCLR